jgi:hypothetical protein
MIERKLKYTPQAKQQLLKLKQDPTRKKRSKAVKQALNHLKSNPKHPSLSVHKYDSYVGDHEEEIWEAYAENKTPGAYRIFFYYGPDEIIYEDEEKRAKKKLKNSKKKKSNKIKSRTPVLTIYAITPHP